MNKTNSNISNRVRKNSGLERYSLDIKDKLTTTASELTEVNSNQTEVSKGNILIVDDQPNSLRLLTKILSEQRYKVRNVTSGIMALKSIAMILPDLLLLDVSMPQMNGYQVCQYLKADPKTCDIPVIFISALDDIFDKVKAFKVGGVDYITKPFQVEEVLARIENQLRNVRLQKQLQLSEAREREKSQKLIEALQKIQASQSQFHLEKMSSLGRLVAGVAHEINNPISVIDGNLYHATQYTQNLLHLVELYQEALPNTTTPIQEEIESIDLEFLKSDFPKLLNSMRVGAKRISEIVKSLHNFTQLDQSQLKTVDLHESIDSTLTMLRHRVEAQPNYPAIEVVKEYGNLPQVECYKGLINQVFMNILSNAIDALEEKIKQGKQSKFHPIIRIGTTLLDKQRVAISIADNGLGITEVVQQLMFDPFFTTKQVGSGTGLGLSISYQIIVDQHGGKLTCFSTTEQGAEFVIELPIIQSK
ncbi:MAG: response regulator [Symploca sp. SIO2G7]|nr:response regulator [Symploca sp. SIO2G7]